MFIFYKIAVYFIAIFLITIRVYSQFTYIKDPRNTFIEYVSPTDYEFLKKADLIDYVAKKRSDKGKYSFTEEGRKDKSTFDQENLYPELKRQLTNYADNATNRIQIPDEYRNIEWLQSEYLKLHNVRQKPSEMRDTAELMSFLRRIDSKPESPAQLWIILKNFERYISFEDPFDAVDSIAKAFEKAIDLVKGEHFKGRCYKIIGDFYERWHMYRPAIAQYYKARESIFNSKLNETEKNIEQARIIEATATLFGDLNSIHSNEKATSYYKSAGLYYRAAGFQEGITSTKIFQNANVANLYSNNWELNTKDNNNLILKDIWSWFTEYEELKIKNKYQHEINAVGLYTIARVLRNQNKGKEAVPYLLESFFCALRGQNDRRVFTSLEQIARAYLEIGSYEKALDFLNLELHLASLLEFKYEKFRFYLGKATAYLSQKKYDSVLIYANTVLYDTTVNKNHYLSRNLYIWGDDIKIQALDSLNIKADSARIYERALNSHWRNNDIEFVRIVQTEFDYIQNWLRRIKDNEIAVKDELTALKIRDDSLLHLKDLQVIQATAYKLAQADSIVKLKDSLVQARASKDSSDSIIHINAINGLKAKARNDSIGNQNSLLLAERNKARVVNGALIVLLLAGIAITTIIIRNRSKQQKIAKENALLSDKKNEAEKNSAENELKALLHRGKNHEFSSLAQQIEVLSKLALKSLKKQNENNAELLMEKLEHLYNATTLIRKYVFRFHKDTQDEEFLTSVEREIEMSRLYLDVFNLQRDLTDKIEIINNITDDYILKELKIPMHFLHNFIMNSIKHGRDKTIGIDKVTININGGQICGNCKIEIEDNGQGINRSTSSNKKCSGTGITWAKSYIETYNNKNLPFKINFSNSSIYDKSDIGKGQGTLVIIEFKKA